MAGKPRRNPVTDEQILATYRETFSAYKTADALGIGATTVERVLMKLKEPRPGLAIYRQRITKYRGVEQEMREMYETGATLDQVREKFGDGSDYAVKHALRRAGAILRDNPAPLVKAGEIEAVRQMNAQGLGQKAISLQIGRSQSFVGRLMRKYGIPALQKSGPNRARACRREGPARADQAGEMITAEQMKAWEDEVDALIARIRLLEAQNKRLRNALQAVVIDVLEYERINNLSPNPGKQDCWQSITHAREVLHGEVGK